MPADPIIAVESLGPPPWRTWDPFLFCVHHRDDYPEGNEQMGPATSLAGRQIGRDFSGRDGWSMYHGDVVPGFPRHPHRGFETITLARRGVIDHSDSLGATARFGEGDVQWMTAGHGIVHAEMFPLRDRNRPNNAELFQIWINLPAADKHVAPYFTMLWNHRIPRVGVCEPDGAETELVAVAGGYGGMQSPAPPPNSWAADPANDVAIWTLKLDPGARFDLPPAKPGTNRTLYFFRGRSMVVSGREVAPTVAVRVRPELVTHLDNGSEAAEVLMLQGKPIGEPVARRGPFVMNTEQEIAQAYTDYRATGFGGWPWSRNDPVHERETGRFAIHADGRRERPA